MLSCLVCLHTIPDVRPVALMLSFETPLREVRGHALSVALEVGERRPPCATCVLSQPAGASA